MDIKTLDYQASQEIKDVISSIGRTEDVKFSMDERRLAITDFLVNKIHLFELCIDNDASTVIKLTKCITICSDDFKRPHGIVFLGNDHFVVANRDGDITLFECPKTSLETSEIQLKALQIFKGSRFYGKIWSPGSVASYEMENGTYRVIVCNNYLHTVISFTVDLTDNVKIKNKGVLIKRGLSTPDGVCVSPNKKWVAISNHDKSEVRIYKLTPVLNRFSDADGKLVGTAHPHGIRFSECGDKLFVANASGQHLQVYQNQNDSWKGIFEPIRTVKIVDDDVFAKADDQPEEGGVKGIEIANMGKLFVASAEHHVMDFYSTDDLLNCPA